MEEKRKAKARYVWYSVNGCQSEPVQKITQHLKNVHKVSAER